MELELIESLDDVVSGKYVLRILRGLKRQLSKFSTVEGGD